MFDRDHRSLAGLVFVFPFVPSLRLQHLRYDHTLADAECHARSSVHNVPVSPYAVAVLIARRPVCIAQYRRLMVVYRYKQRLTRSLRNFYDEIAG